MIDEYSMLREEIMLCMKTVKNYNNLLYTTTVALFAFAFTYSQSILFLLPFIVIVPLYFLTKREMIQALRIGAYILVFIEPEIDVNWETRLQKYDKSFKRNSHKRIPLNAYLGLSLLCVCLSVANTDFSNFDAYYIMYLILQLLLAVTSIVLFGFSSPNYTKMKKEYIEQWSMIKRNETSEKIKSNILY